MALNYTTCIARMHEFIELSKSDAELAHGLADAFLFEMIFDLADGSLGLRDSEAREVVDLYNKIEKHYA